MRVDMELVAAPNAAAATAAPGPYVELPPLVHGEISAVYTPLNIPYPEPSEPPPMPALQTTLALDNLTLSGMIAFGAALVSLIIPSWFYTTLAGPTAASSSAANFDYTAFLNQFQTAYLLIFGAILTALVAVIVYAIKAKDNQNPRELLRVTSLVSLCAGAVGVCGLIWAHSIIGTYNQRLVADLCSAGANASCAVANGITTNAGLYLTALVTLAGAGIALKQMMNATR